MRQMKVYGPSALSVGGLLVSAAVTIGTVGCQKTSEPPRQTSRSPQEASAPSELGPLEVRYLSRQSCGYSRTSKVGEALGATSPVVTTIRSPEEVSIDPSGRTCNASVLLVDPSATTRAYEIKPVPSSAAEGPEFVIGKNTNQRWPFHVGTSCLKVFTRPPPVRDDKGYVNILDFPGGTWDVESGDMSAAVDWRSPYYLIVEVLDASTAATGEEIRYGEHRGNGAASWYFGAGKYPNYCMERNGGTFWVNLFRTDGPKKPLSNPTVAAAWPLKNLIQENVQLSCSSSNTNVFAVPISDAGITGFGKAPQTVRKEFALEIGAIGYTTRYLRVQPDSSDNYTVISVEMAKDNHK